MGLTRFFTRNASNETHVSGERRGRGNQVVGLGGAPALPREVGQALEQSRRHFAIGVEDDEHVGGIVLQVGNAELQREAFPLSRDVMSFDDLGPCPPCEERSVIEQLSATTSTRPPRGSSAMMSTSVSVIARCCRVRAPSP